MASSFAFGDRLVVGVVLLHSFKIAPRCALGLVCNLCVTVCSLCMISGIEEQETGNCCTIPFCLLNRLVQVG